MGRLATLFNQLGEEKSGWELTDDGGKEALNRYLDRGGLPCQLKIEEHNATLFRYTVAIKRGTNVSLAQRPHPGNTPADLAKCQQAVTALAERMLAE